ncbi:hypothetical protein BDN72DRAFT_887899 [Pluteus cervinus]|uniref:Uncharacterized protein n=1 Tax=Pluteus cervinus TaxID=181527 RepID=A0ACD3AZA6_9AGAR|nr:hypothetical protein BDN72DRAFT_887899 [Pluteus cervinus]
MFSLVSRLEGILFPFNWPLPDLPLEIWFEIFEFAIFVPQPDSPSPPTAFASKPFTRNVTGTNTPSTSIRTKLSLILVCQAWRQVALRILYRQVVVRSPARANSILNVLLQSSVGVSSGHGQWTRHIEVYTHARGSNSIEYLKTLFRIFQCCPRLHKLTGIWNHRLPLEFMVGLSKLYGPTLLGLSWGEKEDRASSEPDNTITSLRFFASFQSLTLLDLRFFKGSSVTSYMPEHPRTFTLPYVRDLIISTTPSSIIAATCLHLPALRHLSLRAGPAPGVADAVIVEFLNKHGPSLQEVDLTSPALDSEPDPDSSDVRRTAPHIQPHLFLESNRCPNLTTFIYPITSPRLTEFIHPNMRRIGLRGIHGLFPDKSPQTRDQLTDINLDRFPNLEVVKTIGFLVDSNSDPLNREVFIWWTERFEKQGIDLLDGEGVLWAYDDEPPPPKEGGLEPVKTPAEVNQKL